MRNSTYFSIGSSGRVGEGGKKHEIYMAAFGGHLFYDLFVQGWGGGMAPSAPPGSATVNFMFFDLVLAAVSKLFVMVFDCPHHDLEKYM